MNIVKCLVEKGANINAQDNYDSVTPLQIASQKDHLDIVEYLVGKMQQVTEVPRENRSRRDVSNNSWMNNSVVNWVKGLISSTESPDLLTSGEHNNHTITAIPEINTTLVNNTIMLGILISGLFNKTQHRQPIHENLLSSIEQSMRLNNLDGAERAIRKMEESPSTYVYGISIHNETALKR